MKKIKILMLHLGYGGVEKQTISMANALCHKYNIEIVSFYKLAPTPAYTIDSQIKIKYLLDDKPNRNEFKEALKKIKVLKVIKEGLKAVKILYLKKSLIKKEIKLNDYDIIFSTRTEYGILLNKYGNKEKTKITEEHNHIETNEYRKKITKNYKNLDYIVVISKYHERLYKEWFNNAKPQIVQIENILNKDLDGASKLNHNAIVSAGRFNYIKDFANLIDVMHYATKDNPSLKLYLLGDGEEKDNLKAKIKEYNLEENIIMPGFVSEEEVDKYFLKSDIYVLTSFKECFPMVIIEAFNAGLPVISYDILAGPKEMIKNGKTGYLIEERNSQKMAEKINKLLNDKESLKKMGTIAKKESQNYTAEKIITKWGKILK